MKFKDMIRVPEVGERWKKVSGYFFLRESTYDMTNRCNLMCEGCYYYEGDKFRTQDETDPEKWRALMQSEKERGITFVVLAGAEPSLVPDLCRVCHEVIPIGAIASNGLEPFPEEIEYRIHISVWGNDEWNIRFRGKECLDRQIGIFARDPRAVFIYTFCKGNIEMAGSVIDRIVKAGGRVSFNQFSSPVGYDGPLRLDAGDRALMAGEIKRLALEYPGNVIYSPYNAAVHSAEAGLHEQFHCPYPRCNDITTVGLGRSFRQYRSNLSWDRSVACCVPDTDCADCRHYAAGSAVVTTRMNQHVDSIEDFKNWLDYVDTYLAVWIQGYEHDAPLMSWKETGP